jgi:hypothetical protein
MDRDHADACLSLRFRDVKARVGPLLENVPSTRIPVNAAMVTKSFRRTLGGSFSSLLISSSVKALLSWPGFGRTFGSDCERHTFSCTYPLLSNHRQNDERQERSLFAVLLFLPGSTKASVM